MNYLNQLDPRQGSTKLTVTPGRQSVYKLKCTGAQPLVLTNNCVGIDETREEERCNRRWDARSEFCDEVFPDRAWPTWHR
jgi:hypothetical protein